MVLNAKLKYHSSDRTMQYMFDRLEENKKLRSKNSELILEIDRIKKYVESRGVVIPAAVISGTFLLQSANLLS
jgi:hypothetical protein